MSSGRAVAIRRINKDMKEIVKSPIEGIGIISIDNDPMKYAVNLRLMQGPYEGYCLQLLLTFTDNYPTKPPKILIFPNQGISGEYHHHIFNDSKGFKKFCFDLLDNDFMSISDEHSGWNPSYSISSLLLQVQNFIADPDLPKDHLPTKEKIYKLMNSMENYKQVFKIKNEDEETEIVHTWKNPYPKMYFKKFDKPDNNKNEEIDAKNKNKDNEIKMQIIKENLTCFMLKFNYIEDPDILLGYPIIQRKGLGKNKIELYPIPEMLTYEGFMSQIGKQDSKLDYYFSTNFKSANNEYYNYWVPIYIDENHYLKNRTAILNSFSIIKYGPRGIKEYDFKSEQIFEILPIILNKMIIGMFNGQSAISSAFIRCYFHYVLLFKKLTEEFEYEYISYLNHKLNLIYKSKYNVKKSIIPDIGDFLVLLLFCDRNIYNEKMKRMWYELYEEFLVRQIYWIFCDDKNKTRIIENMLKDKVIKNSEYKTKLIEEEAKKDCLKMGFSNFKGDNKVFVDVLIKEGMFDRIAFYFYGIFDIKYSKEKVLNDMSNNFKKLFNKSTRDKKCEIYFNLIHKNKVFYEFFEVDTDGKKLYEKKLAEKEKELVSKLIKNKLNLYLKKTVDELLKDKEFLKYVYGSQRGNNLLLITFFAQKKIEEKGFINELEKNYGIYIEVDNFIKEMRQKLNEVQSYGKLFEYIGSEFGKNKTDQELIKKAFEKAKLKGYIRDENINSNINNNKNKNFGINIYNK